MPPNSDDNAGSRRAADFHDAMLQLPGYGDDSIFYVVRYVTQVKQRIRQCDFDEFIRCFTQLNQLWPEGGQEPAPDLQTSEARYERARELKRQAREKIEDYPDLARDFERFTSSGRAVARIFGALEQK